MNIPNKNRQKGQALIVLVLMISIILAIVSATSYRLTTETQSTKAQEDSVRALAAADAGIEVGLQRANNLPAQSYTFADLNLSLGGVDAARSRVLITDTSRDFATPVIPKDGQFTFYVKDYNDPAAPNYASDIYIHFRSESGSDCGAPRTQPAYELTYIYGPTGNLVRRMLVEPCTGPQAISGNSFTAFNTGTYTVDGVTFQHQIIINPATSGMADMKIIIIRPVFGLARFGFTGTNLEPQGKLIRSEAYTTSGPSKIVTIFQSLPQIPAEFFVTTF